MCVRRDLGRNRVKARAGPDDQAVLRVMVYVRDAPVLALSPAAEDQEGVRAARVRAARARAAMRGRQAGGNSNG